MMPLRAVIGSLCLFLLASCGSHGRARALLAAKDYRGSLQAIRGDDKAAHRLRGLAWRGLGRLPRAKRALRLALAVDGRDVAVLETLAQVELELGQLGAARGHFEAAVALGAGKRARGELARLTWLRGALRRHLGVGGEETDFAAAHALLASWPAHFDANLWSEAQESLRLTEGAASRPASGPSEKAVCDPREARRVLRRTRDRELLLARVGEALLGRLRGKGCRDLAVEWVEALRFESSRDARWPLELARIYWLRGEGERTRVLLEEHLYLAKDRARAALRVARMLLTVGAQRRAAAWAVRAMSFGRSARVRAEAAVILKASGHAGQARGAWPDSRPSSVPASGTSGGTRGHAERGGNDGSP